MNQKVYSASAIRCSSWQFLSGKAASAVLTFVILLWLVRLLPLSEYGAYAVLIAGTELGFALAGIGLPWLSARYIPDYRLHAAGPILCRFCWQLLLWHALALMVLAGIIACLMDDYLYWAGLSDYDAAAYVALVLLVVEGQGRFVQEGLMAPLMLQGQVRMSLILRQFSFLTAIGALFLADCVNLYWVLVAELLASFVCWVLSSIALAGHLRVLWLQQGESNWLEPQLAEKWRIALRMHGAHLIALSYGLQVFVNIIQRNLGAEAAALFGFLRVIHGQVSRYLPASLLFNIIRPKLIASYFQGGMSALARQVNIAGKLSLFILLAIIVFAALGSDDLVLLLSGNKFDGAGGYFVGILLVLVPFSQRQLLETVAVASARSGLCTLASAIGLLALPIMLFLFDLGWGLWAPLVAMLLGQILFNVTVLLGLERIGYRTDWSGAFKLAVSAILSWLIATGVHSIGPNVIWLVLGYLVSVVAFIAAAWGLQVFTLQERQFLDRVLGRQFFSS